MNQQINETTNEETSERNAEGECVAAKASAGMSVDTTSPKRKRKTAAKKIAADMQPPNVPVHEDPYAELRRLGKRHAQITKQMVSLTNQRDPRRSKETGMVIKDGLPDDVAADVSAAIEKLEAYQDEMVRNARPELRRLPVHQHFTKHAAGLGEGIVTIILLSMVDITQSSSVSQLKRFCGLGIDNHTGCADRRRKLTPEELQDVRDGKRAGIPYVGELRTRLYQWFVSMRKNAAPSKTGRLAKTNKYLLVADGYAHRMQHSARVSVEHNIIVPVGKEPFIAALKRDEAKLVKPKSGMPYIQWGAERAPCRAAKKFIMDTGRRKACDVMLEDLYIVWRTVEGLPVRPSYHSEKLGFAPHRGRPIGTRVLTLEEALDAVGDAGWAPLDVAVLDAAE